VAIFKGQNVVRGKAEDAIGGDGSREVAAGAEGEVHGVGSFVVGDDDDRGDLRGAGEERNVEGAGGGGESRDTTPPTGKRQVPPCLFEGG
jgi:hypothetical protein